MLQKVEEVSVYTSAGAGFRGGHLLGMVTHPSGAFMEGARVTFNP